MATNESKPAAPNDRDVGDQSIVMPYSDVRHLRKCVDTIKGYRVFHEGQDGWMALNSIDKIVLSLEDQNEYPYGICPHCGAKGVERERRPDGNDRCSQGHVYPSRASVSV